MNVLKNGNLEPQIGVTIITHPQRFDNDKFILQPGMMLCSNEVLSDKESLSNDIILTHTKSKRENLIFGYKKENEIYTKTIFSESDFKTPQIYEELKNTLLTYDYSYFETMFNKPCDDLFYGESFLTIKSYNKTDKELINYTKTHQIGLYRVLEDSTWNDLEPKSSLKWLTESDFELINQDSDMGVIYNQKFDSSNESILISYFCELDDLDKSDLELFNNLKKYEPLLKAKQIFNDANKTELENIQIINLPGNISDFAVVPLSTLHHQNFTAKLGHIIIPHNIAKNLFCPVTLDDYPTEFGLSRYAEINYNNDLSQLKFKDDIIIVNNFVSADQSGEDCIIFNGYIKQNNEWELTIFTAKNNNINEFISTLQSGLSGLRDAQELKNSLKNGYLTRQDLYIKNEPFLITSDTIIDDEEDNKPYTILDLYEPTRYQGIYLCNRIKLNDIEFRDFMTDPTNDPHGYFQNPKINPIEIYQNTDYLLITNRFSKDPFEYSFRKIENVNITLNSPIKKHFETLSDLIQTDLKTIELPKYEPDLNNQTTSSNIDKKINDFNDLINNKFDNSVEEFEELPEKEFY